MSNVSVSKGGALETALAEALRKATAEGRWDAVVAIAEALREGVGALPRELFGGCVYARRSSRAGTTSKSSGSDVIASLRR